MTPTTLNHHLEQMEAARAEFGRWWAQQAGSDIVRHLGRRERLVAELVAWRAFLVGKGLGVEHT